MDFNKWKHEKLSKVDLSRKGSVDEHVLNVVSTLNNLPQYFTTSSCSGRTILFENQLNEDVNCPKKGCKWLYVSHETADSTDVLKSVQGIEDEAVFKFEPMVMHVQCRTLEDAQKLHQASVASGFRNSGISVGSKGKIILAVRSTHGLEAPVSSRGKLIVSEQYIEFLVQSANSKMKENFQRINRFLENVKALPSKQDPPPFVQGKKSSSSSTSKRREKTIKSFPLREDRTSSSRREQDVVTDADFDLEEGLADMLFENT